MEASRLLPLALVVVVSLAACRKEPESSPVTPAAPASVDAPTTASPGPDSAASNAPTLANLLRKDDTLATAKARLGDANAVAGELPGPEGETYPGWVLYPDDPMRKVEVALDAEAVHPMMLQLHGDSSVWERPDGVKLGMTAAQLQEKNGKPFEFYGFDWDYGGSVAEWHDGAFDPRMAQVIGTVTLCPPENAPADYPSGEARFRSDDPRVRAHPAKVCAFSMNLKDE